MTCEHPCCGSLEAVHPFMLTVLTFGAISLALCRLHRFQLMLSAGMNPHGVGV